MKPITEGGYTKMYRNMHPHPDEWWQCHNYFMNLCSDRDLVHLAVHILANNYNDNDNNNYASYICPDCDLVHLSAHIIAKKTGQTCLSLVLHMLMPEVFPDTVSKYLSKDILPHVSWYIRCVDPTELGSYMSSVACPACPKGGFLLPGHIQVEKER